MYLIVFRRVRVKILFKIESLKFVNIFLQIGMPIMSGGANFYDYIADRGFMKDVVLKILHADTATNPYLSEKSASHRTTSDFERWQVETEHASKMVRQLEDQRFGKEVARNHLDGYLWRLFVFDEYAYMQHYLYDQNNSSNAPVYKFSRSASGCEQDTSNDKYSYKTFSTFFDLKWEECKSDPVAICSILPQETKSSRGGVVAV